MSELDTKRVRLRGALLAAVALMVLATSGCAHLTNRQPTAFKPLPLPPVHRRAQSDANGVITAGNPATAKPLSLYSDHRQWSVGDIVTVKIVENASASNNVKSKVNHASNLKAGVSTFFGLPLKFGSVGGSSLHPNAQASSTNKSNDSGKVSQSQSVQTSLAATVTRILPNGDLEIAGQTQVNLSGGTQHIRVSGLVRPEDIGPNDTVASTKVADAHVEYSGNGVVWQANRPGWMQRLFYSLWPF